MVMDLVFSCILRTVWFWFLLEISDYIKLDDYGNFKNRAKREVSTLANSKL